MIDRRKFLAAATLAAAGSSRWAMAETRKPLSISVFETRCADCVEWTSWLPRSPVMPTFCPVVSV